MPPGIGYGPNTMVKMKGMPPKGMPPKGKKKGLPSFGFKKMKGK